MPKVIDSRITWKLWCGHVFKCSEESERMKRKSPFSTNPLSFDAPSPANPREYLHKPYTARNYTFPGLHSCRWQYMGSSANFRTVLSESRRRQAISCRARNRLPIESAYRLYHDFLLVINSNFCRIENRQFVPTPPSFNALARGDPLRILGWTWCTQKLEWRGYHMVKKSWS